MCYAQNLWKMQTEFHIHVKKVDMTVSSSDACSSEPELTPNNTPLLAEPFGTQRWGAMKGVFQFK